MGNHCCDAPTNQRPIVDQLNKPILEMKYVLTSRPAKAGSNQLQMWQKMRPLTIDLLL